MKTFILSFLLLVLSLQISCAAGFSLSPTQIDLEGPAGEEVCGTFFINSASPETFQGELFWERAGESGRDLSSHIFKSSEIGINSIFSKNLTVKGLLEQRLCFISHSPGIYHGVLLYRMSGKPIRAGLWITFFTYSGKDTSLANPSNLGVSGHSVSGSYSLVGFVLLLDFFVLLVLFSFLILMRGKRLNK
jgi:hypothetical protein